MKLSTLFISNSKQAFAKTLTVPKSTLKKKKAMLAAIHFEILLTLEVICKQRFFYENEIIQYL